MTQPRPGRFQSVHPRGNLRRDQPHGLSRRHRLEQVIYQTIENLHASIKGEGGDWYFTGNYPTPGGFSMVNQAYVRWHEGVGGWSYDLL